MSEAATHIENSERLTSIFGYWPTFHDAEVIDFHLWRGDVEPGQERYVFPVLTLKIHLWELISDVDASGFLFSRHQTLATLRFHDVDDLRMEGFNHQNAIYALNISLEQSEADIPPTFHVELAPAFGIAATFRCSRIEVIDAKPFQDDKAVRAAHPSP